MGSANSIALASISIMAVESIVLSVTLIFMYLSIRQDAKHHREDMHQLTRTFRSSVHAQLLTYLMDLNSIALQYAEELRTLFPDYSDAREVRQYGYVYAILDILDYLVLHEESVDPYLKVHLQKLALLLFLNPKLNDIYNDVKEHQNPLLIRYLEDEVRPVAQRLKREQNQALLDGN